jgi:hypothetical protein
MTFAVVNLIEAGRPGVVFYFALLDAGARPEDSLQPVQLIRMASAPRGCAVGIALFQ